MEKFNEKVNDVLDELDLLIEQLMKKREKLEDMSFIEARDVIFAVFMSFGAGTVFGFFLSFAY